MIPKGEAAANAAWLQLAVACHHVETLPSQPRNFVVHFGEPGSLLLLVVTTDM